VDLEKQVITILTECLSLQGARAQLTRETRLVNSMPEFDSMAVVAVLTALEEQLGFVVGDDLDAATFHSVGTLVDAIRESSSR
jgi:acyl carrier protein